MADETLKRDVNRIPVQGAIDENGDIKNIAGTVSGSTFSLNVANPDSVSSLIDVVDETNITASTHTYDIDMSNSTDLSFSGKFIDADGTLTMTFWGTNDEDRATADLIQVYGYDDENDEVVNSWTVTNGTLTFGVSFNNWNYETAVVQVVASGATNTVIIKGKKRAL